MDCQSSHQGVTDPRVDDEICLYTIALLVGCFRGEYEVDQLNRWIVVGCDWFFHSVIVYTIIFSNDLLRLEYCIVISLV
jgi:hypothetical protein